ncbi:hypothetical protein [Amycolatopsis plumensis]|uniref:Uncharacterized protein n=1 Tax=Amycolatopsis plumensis TaxID=236508 RepID=A0ABV5UIW0_9PSEU
MPELRPRLVVPGECYHESFLAALREYDEGPVGSRVSTTLC